MAGAARAEKTITLDEFLRLPEIDEHPYLEYIDGRVEAKVSPQRKHSVITGRLITDLNAYAEPDERGLAFPELRCTFAGRSIILDVVFLLDEHIETDDRGEFLDPTFCPPDIDVEIVSPDQPVRKCREKMAFTVANGCPLGWLIDPKRRSVYVYRPHTSVERLPDDGALDGDPVLPGYRLPLTTLFGWLKRRRPDPPDPHGESRPYGGAPRR
jgi:Uma2 family endonuclease